MRPAGLSPDHSTDPGLSDERTALAWQRTASSLVAAPAILTRLAWPQLGLGALAALVGCSALACWVLFENRRRYAHDHGARGRVRPRSGRAPALLAAATVLLGATQLGRIITG